MNTQLGKPAFEFFAAAAKFAECAAQESLITHARSRRSKRCDVYRVRRLSFSEMFGDGAMRENAAQAQAGEPSGFGKRARYHQIVVTPDPGENCDSGEFEIGFVHNYQRVRG